MPKRCRQSWKPRPRGGDVFLVGHDHGEPGAYVLVGESASEAPEGEGVLLRGTHTAQIKSAYARPASRGKGIGKALLRAAVQWAQYQGYDRIPVEHETASYSGGRFWEKHLAPYLYFSLRCIDNSIWTSSA